MELYLCAFALSKQKDGICQVATSYASHSKRTIGSTGAYALGVIKLALTQLRQSLLDLVDSNYRTITENSRATWVENKTSNY